MLNAGQYDGDVKRVKVEILSQILREFKLVESVDQLTVVQYLQNSCFDLALFEYLLSFFPNTAYRGIFPGSYQESDQVCLVKSFSNILSHDRFGYFLSE